MLLVQIMPRSQSEIRGRKGSFLQTVFAEGTPETDDIVQGEELVELVLSSGFPEVFWRKNWVDRHDWYTSYVRELVL